MKRQTSIRSKLIRLIMIINVIVAVAICAVFCVYEYYTFRQRTVQKLDAYGQIIALNSTAALAFQSPAEAVEILSALKAEPQIVAAAIYDNNGKLFCSYPVNVSPGTVPLKPGPMGYEMGQSYIEGFQPIVQHSSHLGTLYLKSNMQSMFSQFKLFATLLLLVLGFAFALAFLLSRFMQRGISKPILALAKTAQAVSERQDYTVRAVKADDDEVGSLTDAFNQMLTEIQKQTETLNEFNNNLEEKVTERTAELEMVNKELESFSYSISHDLRAPVRAINSYTEIFLEDYGHQQTPDGKRLLEKVIRNSQKMGMLIDDLLSFSHLGRKELVKSDLAMQTIVEQVWEDQHLEPMNVQVQLRLDNLPTAFAERSTMEQVWTNLIANALKYSRHAVEPSVYISGKNTKQGVVYCIKDNGSGFDMAYYDKLFGVFQRLHSQQEFEGTGVGLAIVERIIVKHGGKIWAESTVGEGAEFCFLLPTKP